MTAWPEAKSDLIRLSAMAGATPTMRSELIARASFSRVSRVGRKAAFHAGDCRLCGAHALGKIGLGQAGFDADAVHEARKPVTRASSAYAACACEVSGVLALSSVQLLR